MVVGSRGLRPGRRRGAAGALRAALPVWCTTPTPVLHAESGIPPIRILLNILGNENGEQHPVARRLKEAPGRGDRADRAQSTRLETAVRDEGWVFPVPQRARIAPGAPRPYGTACNVCNKARAKCVGELPCERCVKRGLDCVWVEKTKHPVGHNDPKPGQPRVVGSESTRELHLLEDQLHTEALARA